MVASPPGTREIFKIVKFPSVFIPGGLGEGVQGFFQGNQLMTLYVPVYAAPCVTSRPAVSIGMIIIQLDDCAHVWTPSCLCKCNSEHFCSRIDQLYSMRKYYPFNLFEICWDLERRRRKFWGFGTGFGWFLRQKRCFPGPCPAATAIPLNENAPLQPPAKCFEGGIFSWNITDTISSNGIRCPGWQKICE